MGISKVKGRAVYLDRDGVINKAIVKDMKACSPQTRDEFVIMKDSVKAIKRFKDAGLYVMVVTNQPDVARNKLKIEDLDWMHSRIRNETEIDEILVCPHDDEDECSCRKPKPGMLLTGAKKWSIDLKQSYMVGDGWKDMEAGKKAGCTCILIDALYNQDVYCDFRVKGLIEATDVILKRQGG